MKPEPNILIVDDLEVNIFLLETLMKKVDAHLIKASSGFEALKKSQGIELALAIVDVMMPGMNGYELALELNKGRIEDKVPVIFLTAMHGDDLEIFKGYNSGAVDYIIKPINNEILLSKINVFLDLFNQKQTIIRNAAQLKQSADELTRVNAALKKSEEKYRSYIENAPDGVFITDETGNYLEVNDAASTLTGFPKNELLKMSLADIFQEELYKNSTDFFRRLLKTGKSQADLFFIHKNGLKRWCTVEAVKLEGNRFLCFTKDITDRKKVEDELQSSLAQLHQLTQYIEKVREDERVAISRELHDDLGQALTAVKIDLGIINGMISDSNVILKINKLSELVKDSINTVQRLTAQLRPQILDDLGLVAAIEWFTKEFTKRNKIEVFLHIDSGLKISPEASLAIFRIMQESLTNISRHAKASRADIWLSKAGENIILTISDNGIGITADEIKSNKSFGIIGMKERVASFKGSFEIYPGKEKGTEIKINFPLNYKGRHENPHL
jgi:two-component system sensor histidine kinase UhpB